MLKHVLGIPLNSIEEAFRNAQQIEVVHKSLEWFMIISDNVFPPIIGTIIKRHLIGSGDVTFNGSDMWNNSGKCGEEDEAE